MKGPKIVATPPGPKAREFMERDKKVMSPSLTRTAPLVGVEAEGVWVKDIDGNIFLDFSSGIAVTNIGHGDPRVMSAIREQAEKAIHINSCDFYTLPQVDLAEKLFEVTPGDFKKRIFFGNSGTEAVEAALKIAQWHTQNYYVISFIGGFHGRTMGSLQLTTPGVAARRHFKGMMPGAYHTPYPYCYRCPFKLEYPDCGLRCLEYIEDTVLDKLCPPEDASCLIVEPIQGAAGYIVPPDEFMPRLAKLCKEHGIILVADEVQTGFGRSGEWFACNHWDVKPDIITVSKAIASGLPCGAAIARAEIMDWESGAHENTLGGNPVVCSAALSVVDAIRSDDLVENSAKIGSYLLERFEEMAEDHPIIGDVRGKGLMIGLELVKDRESKEPAKKQRDELMRKAFKRGLILLGAGVSSLRLAPPLILTKEQADAGLRVFEDALSEVEEGS
ncbi:4-aminobutyrate aminotransferase [candidate division MSBL1 archaeon SCGC-AAA261O19]|uniref:4-aminobutyrate aminotransferase n=1 Tax=candidate division MSBL1 archaeon SCGC-AAA261O19 TaxID=1698277 RepID=A0A133VCR2_9EURY|nr:4-aminobutyrate aminotransferase [candidate division MSBL1 archaeon SCGC-AAA261O19]